jgi:hypothetical protein
MQYLLADMWPLALMLLDDPVIEQCAVNIFPKQFQGPANALSALENFPHSNAYVGRMLLLFTANILALSVDLARCRPAFLASASALC